MSKVDAKEMASFVREFGRLTNEQLRNRLQSLGETVGPMLPSFRPIFENRLVKYFTGNQSTDRNKAAEEEGSESDSDAPSSITESKIGQPAENGPILSKPVTKHENDTSSMSSEEDASSATSSKPVTYYGVGVPADAEVETDSLVFTNKDEVMKLIKKVKGARFKSFPTFEEAEKFSEEAQASLAAAANSPAPKRSEKNQAVLVDNSGMAAESSLFKGPKIQELVRMRRSIECGDLETVQNLIWSNPRYLISSGDTPTILQEGFRYNALHVAATKNQPEIIGMIIDTLEDPKFTEMLYPQETPESRLKRIDFIVDLYLNTPDKGNWESPLHFASKFGNVEVVKILASHPKTDKNRRNKYEETPADVACSRSKNRHPSLQQEILKCLEDNYYVPLFRTTDNVSQPVIGEPWSPDMQKSKSPLPGSPVPNSPKDPAYSVRAYAGPMSPQQAGTFRRHWSSPCRGKSTETKLYHEIRRGDGDKGMERIGRTLAKEMEVPWTEEWSFLGCFADLTSDDGLQKLENYLRQKAISVEAEQTLLGEKYQSNQANAKSPVLGNLNHSDGEIDLISDKLGSMTLYSPDGKPLVCSPEESQGNTPTACLNGINKESKISHTENEQDSHSKGDSNSTAILTNQNGKSQCDVENTSSESVHNNSEDVQIVQVRWDNVEEKFEGLLTRTAANETNVNKLTDNVRKTKEDKQDLTYSKAKSKGYFITGLHPSKLDQDVLCAIESVSMDPEEFPYICAWKNLVLTYSSRMRQSWPSPAVLEKRLHRTTAQPQRAASIQHLMRPSPLAALDIGTSSKKQKLKDVQKNLLQEF